MASLTPQGIDLMLAIRVSSPIFMGPRSVAFDLPSTFVPVGAATTVEGGMSAVAAATAGSPSAMPG